MRKFICLMIALLMCVSLVLPAMAEDSTFIPSNGPEVKTAVMEGRDAAEKVIVTSVTEAKEQATEISQESRDLLVEVYDALSDGSMKLPVEDGFIYVELSDVTLTEELTADLTVEFEMIVQDEGDLQAFAYVDEEWKEVKSVSYDGVGIVTCVFEELCPVVFILRDGSSEEVEPTDIVAGGINSSADPGSRFVPSITYKDGTEVTDVSINLVPGMGDAFGEGIDECVVVTSIAQAKDKSTDISQEDRDLLLEVYEQLENGSMKLPLKGETVVKELVDISFEYEDCRLIEEHGHKDEVLKQEGVTLTVQFAMNLSQEENLAVLSYIDGQWVEVESTEINADGTVTCVFEDVCPVAFVLCEAAEDTSSDTAPWTGDVITTWVIVMVVCAAGLVAAVVFMKKRK